jgi:hypothetical protein
MAPPVSTTLTANFVTSTAGVVDTGGKLGNNDTVGAPSAANISGIFKKNSKWP